MPPARHRAGGFGRYVAFTTAAPRHAVQQQRQVPPVVSGGLAVVLWTSGGALGAVAANLHEADTVPRAAVRLPAISIPIPPTAWPTPSMSGARWSASRAVPQAAKVRPPVLLGLLRDGRLTTYCRALRGSSNVAVVTDDGWACRPVANGRGLLSMNAVCRWFYGDSAWAGMIDDNDPDTWRCYRDPS